MSKFDTTVVEAMWKEYLKDTDDIEALDERVPINKEHLMGPDDPFGECPRYKADLSSKKIVLKLSSTCSAKLLAYGAIVLKHE